MRENPSSSDAFPALAEQGIVCREFSVTVDGRPVPAMIGSPPQAQLSPNPILLLSIGGPATHFAGPNDQPARYFWRHGHRVASFPVPCAESLETLRDLVLSGPDPFLAFVEQAKAVIQACIDRGWAAPDRIVVTGISRFAYMAFRLMAADDRLNVGAGFAPVIDWRDLSEFAPCRHQPQIADLGLSNFVDRLTGKKIYLCIGGHDERVNTRRCCQFFLDLYAANVTRGMDPAGIDFLITPDPDHYCTDEWINRGMEILLNRMMPNTPNVKG